MKTNKFILWLRKIKPSKRKIIQLYAALLHNANLKGFISGKIFKGDSKVLCAPGLNCYSCPGAVGACPLGTLQNSLSSANKRLPFYVFGILMLYGLILGRTICGFLCPMGLLQEFQELSPLLLPLLLPSFLSIQVRLVRGKWIEKE